MISQPYAEELARQVDELEIENEQLRAYQNETAKAWTKLTESQEQEIEHLKNLVEYYAREWRELRHGND